VKKACAPVLLLLILSGCAASPKIVSQTPAGIEIDCWQGGLTCSETAQGVADIAQKHCRQHGLDARQRDEASSPSGRRWVAYDCVNNTGAPSARAR
jgi:hypothetical protein